ncbi:stage V sporulation protein AB [Siminovitchia sp. FSL H7-0308]|uniref:Stage V sporulation protein AB n=1 Tax=Siminovitchia thermophila TaxID=1245522 RepID=A0ABS2R219_9BACI|nr:stage V sporulation protein AB [Siminovitchia thermophila]MBM7713687.1 stage V sporulation protein AB [Siminovitchia thermophila]ONK21855.1 stage V sporulation protein AB [Bacillus sp. VT-16-64]
MKRKKVQSGLTIVSALCTIFVGLAGGLAVGIGFVAFLTVLGIIPRLTQLTKTGHQIQAYEWAVIISVVVSSLFDLRNGSIKLYSSLLIPVGLANGLFIGMLAAALTEVLNVLPILSKRIGMKGKLILLLMALVFGKMAGSLFQWLYFVEFE